MSFKQKRILIKAFVESQFELMQVYDFQNKGLLMNKFVECQFEVVLAYEFKTKANSYEDIS